MSFFELFAEIIRIEFQVQLRYFTTNRDHYKLYFSAYENREFFPYITVSSALETHPIFYPGCVHFPVSIFARTNHFN